MSDLSVVEMRKYVANAYEGEGWKYRVMNVMRDNQVIAIYRNLINRQYKKEQEEKEKGRWVQMTIGRYLEERDYAKSHVSSLR